MSDKEISAKMQEIVHRIKNRREELNMSYQTLSEKVGISKSTLQRYETGYIKNMPVDKLEDVASALNVSPAYLMGWESPTPRSASLSLTDTEKRIVLEYRKSDEITQAMVRRALSIEEALSDTGKEEQMA